MNYLIIPINKLKEWDSQWEYRRRSNDGKKAILHQEIYDGIFPPEEEPPKESVEPPKPQPMMMRMMAAPMAEAPVPQEPEQQYPYPLVSGEELDLLDEFKAIEGKEETAHFPEQ